MAFPAIVQRETGLRPIPCADGRTARYDGQDAQRFRRRGDHRSAEESYDGGTYRAVYTVRYAEAIHRTLPEEIENRHQDADNGTQPDQETITRFDRGKGEAAMTKRSPAEDPARNVWLQLGLPGAEEHYLKAELVLRLIGRLRRLPLRNAPPRTASEPHSPNCRKFCAANSPKSHLNGCSNSWRPWAAKSKSRSHARRQAKRDVPSPSARHGARPQ